MNAAVDLFLLLQWTIRAESDGFLIGTLEGDSTCLSIGPEIGQETADHDTLVMSDISTFWKFIPISQTAHTFRLVFVHMITLHLTSSSFL